MPKYVTSIERRAIACGLQQGMQEGRTELLNRQLTRRFGLLASACAQRVNQLSLEQQEQLAEALLDFRDEGDLEAWLART